MSKRLAQAIIEDLLSLETVLGHQPTQEEYEARGRYGYLIQKTFLGGWSSLLKAIAKRNAAIADQSRQPRLLLFDLETAPMELQGFGLYDQNFSVNQIKRDSFILSFAAKWLGEPAIIYADLRKDPPGDDTRLLKVLWGLLDQADIVITQNGKSFDEKVANARFVVKGLPPTRPYKHIDTKLLAKRRFRFPSNSLEYLANALGVDVKKGAHKKFPGFELWKEVLLNNQEAWEEMRAYNVADVLALEGVYLKLRGWGTPGVNLNLFKSEARYCCESCGGTNLKLDGTDVKTSGRYVAFQCQDCGRWGAKKGSGNNLFSEVKKGSLRGP